MRPLSNARWYVGDKAIPLLMVSALLAATGKM